MSLQPKPLRNRNGLTLTPAEITRDIIGYQIQAGDEIAGFVTDFMMDDQSWKICHLVVNTGNRFSENKVLLSPDQIGRISWDESKLYANVTKEAIMGMPAGDGPGRAMTDAGKTPLLL